MISERYSKVATTAPRNSLYNNKYELTSEATILQSRLENLLKSFFDRGYSPREIAHLIIGVALKLESQYISKNKYGTK